MNKKELERSMKAARMPSINGLWQEGPQTRIRIQKSFGVWHPTQGFAYFCTITIYKPGPGPNGWAVHQHSKACTVPAKAHKKWKLLPRLKTRCWVIRYREKPMSEGGIFWYSHNVFYNDKFKHLVNVPNHAVEFGSKQEADRELKKLLRARMGFAHDAKKQLAVFRRGRRKSG